MRPPHHLQAILHTLRARRHRCYVQTLKYNALRKAEAPGSTPVKFRSLQKTTGRKNFNFAPWRDLMVCAIVCAMWQELTAPRQKAVIKAAAASFQNSNPGAMTDQQSMYLAKDTANRLQTRGWTEDAARSGRPETLTDECKDELLDVFLGGFRSAKDSTWWGFSSIEHAISQSERFRSLVASSGLTVRHLWTLMQERHRKLHGVPLNKISIKIKLKLTEEVRQERLAAAKEWLTWTPGFLRRIIWIDEKQEYISPGGTYQCYAPCTLTSFQREDPNGFPPKTRVKWMLATSAVLGCAAFFLVTGTTGKPSVYRVRTGVPPWTDHHGASLPSRAPCCIDDLHLNGCI